jgi:hypothetical protein
VNELIEQLKSRVGLDDNKANSAVQTVIGFLKQRLPGSVGSQLDTIVSGGSPSSSVQDVKEKIGDVFGKKTA